MVMHNTEGFFRMVTFFSSTPWGHREQSDDECLQTQDLEYILNNNNKSESAFYKQYM
jgi:hypothetical protein